MDLTYQSRNSFNTLLFEWARNAETALNCLCIVEILLLAVLIRLLLIAKVVTFGSLPVSLVMIFLMLVNY